MKFYLAREGVAFGPYTEFQLRESVRLGIFEGLDLALPENATEWVTLSDLFPPPTVLSKSEHGEADGKSNQVSPPVLDEQPESVVPLPRAKWNEFPIRRKLALATIPLTIFCCWLVIKFLAKPDQPVHVTPITAATKVNFRTTEPTAVAAPKTSLSIVGPVDLDVPRIAEVSDQAIEQDDSVPLVPGTLTAHSESAATDLELTPVDPSAQRQIEGQIYISAKNGINYEPSSVEVRLYPLSLLKPYLEKRSSEASARFEQLKSQISEAEAEKELLRKAADAAFDACLQANPGNRRALEAASADAKKAREKATNVYYELLQNRQDLLSGAFYIEDLPKAADVARTNSQGRFTFTAPVDGEFAVVAGTQRGTDEQAERYYWFIPVSNDGESRKTVLLSNNNVSSHGSADSLVQTAD